MTAVCRVLKLLTVIKKRCQRKKFSASSFASGCVKDLSLWLFNNCDDRSFTMTESCHAKIRYTGNVWSVLNTQMCMLSCSLGPDLNFLSSAHYLVHTEIATDKARLSLCIKLPVIANVIS